MDFILSESDDIKFILKSDDFVAPEYKPDDEIMDIIGDTTAGNFYIMRLYESYVNMHAALVESMDKCDRLVETIEMLNAVNGACFYE